MEFVNVGSNTIKAFISFYVVFMMLMIHNKGS